MKYDNEESANPTQTSSNEEYKDKNDKSKILVESEETKNLNMTELERLVLTEKLQYLRMQIRSELNSSKKTRINHFNDIVLEHGIDFLSNTQ